MNEALLKKSIKEKVTELIRRHGSASFALTDFQAALERTRPASMDPGSIAFTEQELKKMAEGDFDALTPFALHQIDKALDAC